MKNPSAFRFWAPAILLGASSLSPLVCISADGQTPQAATQPLLDKAHALEVRGRMDLAAQTWQQVLLTDPNNTEALGGLARAAKLSGNLSLASTYLDRLRAINPNDPNITRVEQMSTQADTNTQLREAGKLAEQGQYAQAMNAYRQVYGTNPPPGDIALGYYETESATEEGRPHAIAGLRALVEKFPGDERYQVALGRILTYNPRTRAEGRHLLEQHPNDPRAVEALRQSLLWDSENPATAGDIRAYLTRHPDTTLANVLNNEPRGRRMTAEQRAYAAVNATRNAEDRAAYRDLNEHRLGEAEEKFKAILAQHPDNPNALAGMGYIRMQQANFGGAISFLVQAKSDGSRDPGLEGALEASRFWYTMGEGAIALNDENLPLAEKQYRDALHMRPTSTEALEGLGGTLLKAGQPEAAAPYFAQYIKLKPGSARAWRGLFLAQWGTGNGNRALATEHEMPAAVRAELMKDPLYLQSLASAYSSVGRDADAQRVLHAALELPFSPSDTRVETETKLQYAALLQAAGRLEQAAGLYRAVLAKEPNNVAAFRGLVRVEHAAGEDERALETIESMPPEVYSKALLDGGFDQTVASIYQSQHRLDVAQDILEKALHHSEADGGKPPVSIEIQLAGIYLELGDADQAYPIYQKVLSQHPDRLDAWKGLISALHTTGHDQEALAQVQQMPPAIRVQLESDVSYLQTVGSIYAALGEPQESQIFLRRVEEHYATEHTRPPADVDIQEAWLLYNGMNDAGLYRVLIEIGGRPDLTIEQRRTVQSIWTNWAVRRANQASAAGNDTRALAILNATARAFPDNPDVIKALAGGYARAGRAKEAVAIWKSIDLRNASVDDYRSAIGSALAAQDTRDAEIWLRFALNQYPQDSRLLILGAKFEQQRGDTDRAEDYYRVAIKSMPKDDPGAALSTELSHPSPGPDLPGSPQAGQDLSRLLAPERDHRGQAQQPYLPGGSDVMPPIPMGGSYQYPPSDIPAAPANPQPAPGGKPRLGDYVPQAAVDVPDQPAQRAARAAAAPLTASIIEINLQESSPVVSPPRFEQQQVVRVAEAKADRRSTVEEQPKQLASSALSFGATFRGAAYAAQPQQVAQTTAQAKGSQDANGEVYGPYVPYVPPAAKPALTWQPAQPSSTSSSTATGLSQGATYRSASYDGGLQQQTQQAQAPQPQAAPAQVSQPQVPQPTAAQIRQQQGQPSRQQQVSQPGAAQPLTVQPARQAVSAPGGVIVDGVVYGPYVPYTPPPVTQVNLGSAQPASTIKQPEVTDVLPTAKYSANGRTRRRSSKADLEAARAAAERKSAAAARLSATLNGATNGATNGTTNGTANPAVGESKPPAEDYSTPSIEPAQYTTPQAQPLTATPQNSTNLYTKPAQYPQQGQQYPQQQVQQGQTGATVPQQSEGYGQQYPQPGTATSHIEPDHREAEPVTHRRIRNRKTHEKEEVAAAPSAPPPPPQPAPALTYPGIGSPLGYQPYPLIGPAYPLPAAPTDEDLAERRLPPLGGGYYNGVPLTPQVPLTERQIAERDLDQLEGSYSGWLGATGSARYRSGVLGYDRLTDLETTVDASITGGNSVRLTVVPKAVFLNSGQLNVGNYTGIAGSPVLGTLNTAVAAVAPAEQSANGIGGEVQVTARNFAAAVGYTPYEFLVQNVTGRAIFRPNDHFTLFFNRDSVVETELSYAGLRDPGSATAVFPGNIWGGVVATGGGVRFDQGNEKAGFYITGDGANLTGYHVLGNNKFEGSLGAYFLAHTFPGYGRINVGAAIFGMHFAQNERPLSYGLGGYFSPNAYFLASVPITFTGRYSNNFHYTIAGAVGVQSFTEASQQYFPLDRGLETGFQTSLNCTTAQFANHTCAQYPTFSNTGGNYSINTEGAYRIADHWYAGGFVSANNTNNYNTITGGFFVRYLFRRQVGTDDYPTGLFPVDGFRPLRVP